MLLSFFAVLAGLGRVSVLSLVSKPACRRLSSVAAGSGGLKLGFVERTSLLARFRVQLVCFHVHVRPAHSIAAGVMIWITDLNL